MWSELSSVGQPAEDKWRMNCWIKRGCAALIENLEREEVGGVNGSETADSEGRSLVSVVRIGIGGSNQASSCTRSGSAIRPAPPRP